MTNEFEEMYKKQQAAQQQGTPSQGSDANATGSSRNVEQQIDSLPESGGSNPNGQNSDNNMYNDDRDEYLSTTQEDLVAGMEGGLEFDINKASKFTKAPDKINLDGKEVVITDIKLILPKPEATWELTRDKKNRYKNCQFTLYYDNEGQREHYSGIKVFPREVNGQEKYSEPNIQNNAKNQASLLKGTYAAFKGKKPEEVSMYEFLSFLKSKPRALIKQEIVEYDGKNYEKNIVAKFL